MTDEQPTYREVVDTADDEINLFELFQALRRHKWWIVGCTVVALILAAVYLLMTPSTYQVKTRIEPVAAETLLPFTTPGVEYTLSSDDAFKKVQQKLASWRVRKTYYEAHQDLLAPIMRPERTRVQSLQYFDQNNFDLHLPKISGKNLSRDDQLTYISLRYHADMNGVAIANGLMAYAIAQAKEEVVDNFKNALAHQLAKLRRKISIKRATYLGQIRTRKARVDEALFVAKRLGIVLPSTPSDFGDKKSAPSRSDVRAIINSKGIPLYFRGSKALQSEMTVLAQQTIGYTGKAAIESPFEDTAIDKHIDGLYKLKQKGRYLQSVAPQLDSLKIANITREAASPSKAIKPKKKLVLAIALVLGLMLGCFIALIRAAWVNHAVDAGSSGTDPNQATDE